MADLSFTAQIDDWVKATEARMLAVRNQAADDVIEKMREYTPVDTGFLAGTIQGSINSPVGLDKTNEKKTKLDPAASTGEVSLVIAGSTLSDTIYGCFVMNYASYVEYGTSKMAARAMVRRAANEWPQIVSAAVSRAKAAAQ